MRTYNFETKVFVTTEYYYDSYLLGKTDFKRKQTPISILNVYIDEAKRKAKHYMDIDIIKKVQLNFIKRKVGMSGYYFLVAGTVKSDMNKSSTKFHIFHNFNHIDYFGKPIKSSNVITLTNLTERRLK